MIEDNNTWFCNLAGKSVGKYILDEFIGNGKIGYVYRGHDKEFPDDDVAIKLIFDKLEDDWDAELKKVLKLRLVENVVHYHAHDTELIKHLNKTHLAQYTVWDFIPPGENLTQYLERNEQVEISFLIAVVEQILRVLNSCLHSGVSRHGDLHAGNILIGKPSLARLDDQLKPRASIFISDFGYRTTGAIKQPKDDYLGLIEIINSILKKINRPTTSATDKQIQDSIRTQLGKLLREPNGAERLPPLELLKTILEIKQRVKIGDYSTSITNEFSNVGSFQVTEMIGDNWNWWKRLFVPTVPARSKILRLDIPTVVTGPRGCGKTMLFRRLSERLIVECGTIPEMNISNKFVAFYINANDIVEPFAHFPDEPTLHDEENLICYSNLCVLSDILSVQAAYVGKTNESISDNFLMIIHNLLIGDDSLPFLNGEDRLERYRTILEQLKWKFPIRSDINLFPGFHQLCQHRWLPYFLKKIPEFCKWINNRSILLFIDDFSMPRISAAMQKILNRLFLQRSSYFLTKLSTESSSTFLPEDSSGKKLEDGDDFQLVDMGEESLFLHEPERLSFLNAVFSRRLEADSRIPRGDYSLETLLGRLGLSKTEFARRLRSSPQKQTPDKKIQVTKMNQRRGRSRAKVMYWGDDVFSCLWSGDTRTMIQLITDIVDQAAEDEQPKNNYSNGFISLPIIDERQDLVFRNRGGEWLSSHERNTPTDSKRVKEELERLKQSDPNYKLCGDYGNHLKAVVEAFVKAARNLLLGQTYIIYSGKNKREVPRMAFRLEIMDDFRIDGLAREIYRDLIRYGLFIRDSRGKSIRGTFVPRLFLRRLLLPYGSLALSKRDSVRIKCKDFEKLLLKPDEFKSTLSSPPSDSKTDTNQIIFPFFGIDVAEDNDYDDLDYSDEDDTNEDDTKENDTNEDDTDN